MSEEELRKWLDLWAKACEENCKEREKPDDPFYVRLAWESVGHQIRFVLRERAKDLPAPSPSGKG